MGYSWDKNEIAFLKFARYKGLKYPQIAPLLDRSVSACYAIGMYVGQFEDGKADPTLNRTKIIEGALVLEYAVRSGQFPDVKKVWLAKIARVTGISYDTPTEAITPEPEIESDTKEATETPENKVGWGSDSVDSEKVEGETRTINDAQEGDFLKRDISGISLSIATMGNRMKVLGRAGQILFVSWNYSDADFIQVSITKLKDEGWKLEN